jgi:hypothetical protein
MEDRTSIHSWDEGVETPAEALVPSARPLILPAPRLAMFFPLVILVAVLPGLYAVSRWDLNPPGPWWGLRGLAVLHGCVIDQVPTTLGEGPGPEAWAYRVVAWQPPLYAWLEAVGLILSPDLAPVATVLPSYVAGALVVILVYLHGRLWRGPGLGVVAAALTAFSPDLLSQMQQASPTTLGLLGTLLSLLCYGKHLRLGTAYSRDWVRGGGIVWALLGGLALGLSLLSIGGFGLICIPLVLLHQAYLRAEPARTERPSRWWLAGRNNPSLVAGALALIVGVAIAAPWHIQMFLTYRYEFVASLLAPINVRGTELPGMASALLALAPVTLPLAILAAVRLFRRAIQAGPSSRSTLGGAFWLLWLATAVLASSLWPNGPRAAIDLFSLVPLNLLAAQEITDLASRRLPVRSLTWLVPATILATAWWMLPGLRSNVAPLVQGRWPEPSAALRIHIMVDIIIISVVIMIALVRWSRCRDNRQRLLLGGFLSVVLAAAAVIGVREVRFRHRETKDLLALRDVILRLNEDQPFDLVAVVGSGLASSTAEGPCPGGRLRFILRSALPEVPQVNLTRADDLLSLPPDGQRLVILVGEERLPYALQARLGLWVIHPGRSGVLDAFATARDISRPIRR